MVLVRRSEHATQVEESTNHLVRDVDLGFKALQSPGKHVGALLIGGTACSSAAYVSAIIVHPAHSRYNGLISPVRLLFFGCKMG